MGHNLLVILWCIAMAWCIKGLFREMLYYQEYRQIVDIKEQLKRLKTLDEDRKTMFLEQLDEMMLHIKDGKLYSDENIAILQEIRNEINKK